MKNSAFKFLERVSIPTDKDGETTEDVAFSDAVYATKVAQLELLLELEGFIQDPFALIATMDGKIRQLKRDRVKIEG